MAVRSTTGTRTRSPGRPRKAPAATYTGTGAPVPKAWAGVIAAAQKIDTAGSGAEAFGGGLLMPFISQQCLQWMQLAIHLEQQCNVLLAERQQFLAAIAGTSKTRSPVPTASVTGRATRASKAALVPA